MGMKPRKKPVNLHVLSDSLERLKDAADEAMGEVQTAEGWVELLNELEHGKFASAIKEATRKVSSAYGCLFEAAVELDEIINDIEDDLLIEGEQ